MSADGQQSIRDLFKIVRVEDIEVDLRRTLLASADRLIAIANGFSVSVFNMHPEAMQVIHGLQDILRDTSNDLRLVESELAKQERLAKHGGETASND